MHVATAQLRWLCHVLSALLHFLDPLNGLHLLGHTACHPNQIRKSACLKPDGHEDNIEYKLQRPETR